MKKIYNYEITNDAVKVIEEYYNSRIEKISKAMLEEVLSEIKGEVIVDGNHQCIWTANDVDCICYIWNGVEKIYFNEIIELNIYVSEDSNDGEYYIQGPIGDIYCFIDYYLGEDETFIKNVRDLVWVDEENILYEKLEEFLNQIDDNDEDDDYISLQVLNSLNCSLEDALREDDYYKDLEFEKIGYFAGKVIYKIGNLLYYLTNDSYSFNTDHYFYLNEVSNKCYENFGLKKPAK